MNEPTPEEAAAALRVVDEGRERALKSAPGARWLWIFSGVFVFLYCAAIDLFPAAQPWLNLATLAVVLVLVIGLSTRVGSTLLGQPVRVSGRNLTLKTHLLSIAPVLGLGLAAGLIVLLLHPPHGGIYYGALAGFYIIFLRPGFYLWLLRRQDKD